MEELKARAIPLELNPTSNVRTGVCASFAQHPLRRYFDAGLLVTPTAPTAAFKIGEKSDDPVAMYLADIYTVTASLAGICGVSVPCGKSRTGLPIGMQILGKHFDESTIFRVGQALESL